MDKIDYIRIFEKYLDHRATQEELQVLIEWLKGNGDFDDWANREWEAAAPEMAPALREELLCRIRKQISVSYTPTEASPKSSLFVARLMRIAAIILFMVAFGSGVYYYSVRSFAMPDMVVSVQKGQKAQIVLPDGSNVWINSDSKLTYGIRFNNQERVLQLDGEAYFEVTPDKQRPFIVETNGMSVKALGTSFDVKSYSEDKEIATVLMTGKVEITSRNMKQIMTPNEKAIYNKETGNLEVTTITDAIDYAGWKDNLLRLNAETIENVAKILERNYNTKIIFKSEALKQYRVTGPLGNTSLESVLEILSLTFPLSYEVKDSLIILRENTKQKTYYESAMK